MDWKTEAVEKLRRYGAMKAALVHLPMELARAENQADALHGASTDKVAVKKSGNNGENRMLDNLVLRQELSWALEDAKYWVQVTEGALKTLNETQKTILDRMYICPDGGAVQDLCQQLDAEQSSIYRWKEEALRRFTLSLYGALS